MFDDTYMPEEAYTCQCQSCGSFGVLRDGDTDEQLAPCLQCGWAESMDQFETDEYNELNFND